MQDMDMLVAYQEADLKIDGCEAELRKSASYKRYSKVRNYLADQKRVIARMSAQVEERQRRIAQTMANADLLEEKFNDAKKKYELVDKTNSSEIERFRKYYEQINQLLAKERREFADLVSSLESDDSQLTDMRNKLGKARKEYDELKGNVESERAEKQGAIEALTQQRDELANSIDPSLIEKYKVIKKSHPVPVAIVKDTRCGGCAMELPAVALRNLKEGNCVVECDNCGRILVFQS